MTYVEELGGAPTARLQAYLRHSALRRYDSVPAPPFMRFFHSTDPLTFFNYAIPDGTPLDNLERALPALQREFVARDRLPRLEFIEEFYPQLAPAPKANGFIEEARQPLMVCTSQTYSPAPDVPALTIGKLTSGATLNEVRTFLSCRRQDLTFTLSPLKKRPRTFCGKQARE